MRKRVANLFMITMLIVLIAVTFGVLGKGEYQPPSGEQGKGKEQGSIVAPTAPF